MTSLVFVNRAGRISGAEVVLLRLVDVAVRQGHRVRVVSPRGPLADRLPAVVEHLPIEELDLGGRAGLRRIVAYGALARRSLRAAFVIRRAAAGDAVVVVNALMALPAARLARIRGGVSWLIHDTVSDAKQRLVVRVGRGAIRRAVAVSPPTADAVRPLGVHALVAPLGIDVPELPQPHVRSGDAPVVGIMGVLTPWKGHRILLQALAKLPDVRCEIAGSAFHGDEDHAEQLRQLAAGPDLAGRVTFLGHVEPLSAIRRWDILVSASTSPEAGPIVALEAMSLGVPVIGTDHGGCAWLLRDGAGVLVPPGDPDALAAAIDSVLRRPDELAAMTRLGRERVVADHDAVTAFPAMLDALLTATEGVEDRDVLVAPSQ